MKRITTILSFLMLVCMGAWADTFTWTSGVAFNENTTGNYSTGWFTVVAPFNGKLTTFTVNLGTGHNDRTDAYLAISRNLKTATTGFSSTDFVAISTNTCGTSGCKIDMVFTTDSLLQGGRKYYFYFVRKSGDIYTTVRQRYHVVSSSVMSVGNVGSTDVQSSAYAMPFSATMTLTSGSYYRIKGNMPTDNVPCYLCSNSGNENKLYKSKTAPTLTNSRYVWKATVDGGVKLQNMGKEHYIPTFTSKSSNGNGVNYLSATTSASAVAFTLVDRVAKGAGYVALKTQYNAEDTYLTTYTKTNDYVGCHDALNDNGNFFLFQQVRKVTFSAAVAVNGTDLVSVIYPAVDGSESISLPEEWIYTIGGVQYNNTSAAAIVTAEGTSDIDVTVSYRGTQLNSIADGVAWTYDTGAGSSSSWNNKWTSGTTPEVELYCGNTMGYINDFKAGTVSGSFLLSTNNTPSYRISVPHGYVIKSYAVIGKATGNVTVTPSEGTASATSFVANTRMGIVVNTSKILPRSVSFQVSPASLQIDDAVIYVEYEQATYVTSVNQLKSNKCYVIRTAGSRGSWYAPTDATALTSTTKAEVEVDVTSANQQFAFVEHEEKYYLYSVSEQKFVTKDGNYTVLTNEPVDNVRILASSGSTEYADVIAIADGETNYQFGISNGYTPAIYQYNDLSDLGNRVQVMEVGDFVSTDALDRFNTNTVTFIVNYGGSEVIRRTGVTVNRGFPQMTKTIDPAMDFMNYTYSPSKIVEETTTITATATWNGPFQLSSDFASAKWYTVGIHAAYEDANHIWKYDSSNSGIIATQTVAADGFENLTNNHLFCFVGNPYDGISIYNKAAGSGKTLYKSGVENEHAAMAETGSLFVPDASSESGKTVANGYACFQLKDGSLRLNAYDTDSYNVNGWGDSGNGSTCWFIPEGKYYLNYLNSLPLNAPAGAVGTKAGITDETTRTMLKGLKTGLEGNLFYMNTLTPIEQTGLPVTLAGIKASSDIALTEGYWRIVSAYSGYVEKQSKMPAIYYNSTENQLRWSIDALTSSDYLVNSIIKLDAGSTDGKYTIYSPNAQKYLYTTATAQSANLGTLDDTGNDITFTSLGSCQYQIFASGNSNGFHTNSHSEGSGSGGTIVAWNGTANTASAWYIVKASKLPVGLHTIDDIAYATICLPFDVTITNAKAYTMVQSGDYLVPTQLEDNKVPAGTPVLLRIDNSSDYGETAYATINTGSAFSTSNDNDLLGVYVPTDFALDENADDENGANVSCTSEYFLGVYNSTVGFYRSGVVSKTGFYTLGANKAYLGNANASRGFSIMWNDDEVTGIRTIDNGKQSVKNGAFYDLSGRRVQNPQHGLYIVNGRKVVIK